MNSKKLTRAIARALGVAAMGALSTQAYAVGASTTNLGVFTGNNTLTWDASAPYKSYSDYSAANLGWIHTASFATLQVGSVEDIANGVTYNVQLSMSGRANTLGQTTAALDNPAFTVWTGGTNSVNMGAAGFHRWSQVRGPNDSYGLGVVNNPARVNPDTGVVENWTGQEIIRTNNAMGISTNPSANLGILDGHDGWIGYVNAGETYYNRNTGSDGIYSSNNYQTESHLLVQDFVGHGGVNDTTPWLTDPTASSTSFTALNTNNSSLALDIAVMNLIGVKSGYYLIGMGGSCPTLNPSQSCSSGTLYTFNVQAATAPVPIPAAGWLFGSALVSGLGFARRRKVKA